MLVCWCMLSRMGPVPCMRRATTPRAAAAPTPPLRMASSSLPDWNTPETPPQLLRATSALTLPAEPCRGAALISHAPRPHRTPAQGTKVTYEHMYVKVRHCAARHATRYHVMPRRVALACAGAALGALGRQHAHLSHPRPSYTPLSLHHHRHRRCRRAATSALCTCLVAWSQPRPSAHT